MRLFRTDNWLKTPADRDVITRWTMATGDHKDGASAPSASHYVLDVPPPSDPNAWEFLALGDTGDSDAAGPGISPQDAVGQQLAADAVLPGSTGTGQARLIVHTGDVIYMTGEKRLYDRNFRRPYSSFLTPESTIDNLVFRIPFLPVPGNHDYYDLGGWARWLARVPFVGAGLRAIAHELFAFSLPTGGSDMGRAYMQAFVDLDGSKGRDPAVPLAYRPGAATRLPNRYYRFTTGGVDFFALDSNTLDAPPPGTDVKVVREAAAGRVKILEARAQKLDDELRRQQTALDRWRVEQREVAAADPERRERLLERAAAMTSVLGRLHSSLTALAGAGDPCARAADAVTVVERRWTEGAADLTAAPTTADVATALDALDEASDQGCDALREVEACVALLPEGPERAQILGARDEVDRAQTAWSQLVSPPPADLNARLRTLSEESLDVQRELTLERRRLRYRPEDHDQAQLRWLDTALSDAERERPGNWRVVYLHHPLYTTISNHCERPDVQDLRENLLSLLKGRVHLVLSGHSHAFEWFRSDLLPNTGLFVSGGGGQISLRPSLLEPRLFARRREHYEALRRNGAVETAMGGRGPAAADGESGLIYHYLRIDVTPETLTVRPVGVRRLRSGGFRREEPMPVFHAAYLPEGRPPWKPRTLGAVEVRRDRPPQPHWGT